MEFDEKPEPTTRGSYAYKQHATEEKKEIKEKILGHVLLTILVRDLTVEQGNIIKTQKRI